MKNSKISLITLAAAFAAITTIPAFAADLTWVGDGSGNVWSSTSTVWGDADTTFSSGDNVTLGSSGSSNSSITIGETITAGTITVSAGGYTLSASDGATLSATGLALSTETGLTIDSSLTANFGAITRNSGANTVVINGTVNVSTDSGTGVININGGYANTFSGTGTLNADTLTFDTSNSSGNLTISTSTLKIGTITGTSSGTGSGNAGSLTISSTNVEIETVSFDSSALMASFITSGDSASVSIGTMSFTGSTKAELGGNSVSVDSLTYEASHSLVISASTATFGTIDFASSYGDTTISSANFTVTGTFTDRSSGSNTSVAISSTTANIGTLVHSGSTTLTISGSATVGDLVVSDGQVSITGSVSVTNAISIVLDNYLVDSDSDVTTTYAIVVSGEGSLSADTITLSVGEELAERLVSGETLEFALLSGVSEDDYSFSFAGYDVTTNSDGTISVVATPEPSMFGLVAGLGALALVATRRRHNRKA